MVTINIEYEGDLHCKAVHGPSSKELETDAPLDNQGKGESFSPTDLLATSLGVCTLTIMGIAARKEDIDLKGTTVTVEKHMTTELPRKVAKIALYYRMAPGIDADKRALLENAAQTCPVALSLHPDVVKDHYFNYPD